MNMQYWKTMAVVTVAVLFSVIGCSSGGGGTVTSTVTSTSTGTETGESSGDGGSTTSGGHTITGQVVVNSSSLPAAQLRSDQIARAKAAAIQFATSADSALPDAEVTLYKISADGTESVVSGVSATTDASGNYTLTNVPDAVTGTGAATDYYYEVRAKSGSIEISAPTAPTGDETVNVSPETNIAAAMISDVASVPSVTNASVLPTGEAIEVLSDTVYDNIGNMTTFTMPSVTAGAQTEVNIAAEAVSSNNGNAEKLMRAYEALLEGLYLFQNRDTVTDDRIAAYLVRITSASCNFQQSATLPQAASAALASSFKNGTTFTLSQIADAYNHGGGTPQVTASSIVTAYNNILGSLNTALTTSADIPDSALIGIYASKGDLSTMTTGSSLQVDQALVLLQALPSQPCQAAVNYIGIVSELLGNTTLKSTAAFADIEVYHQRLQCSQGSLEARVKVYAPLGINDVSNVMIMASGLTNTSGAPISSAMTLTHDDFPSLGTSNWKVTGGNTQACLVFGQTYTFTITAGLSSGGTLTTTVSRTIVDVPEARITLMAKDYSESSVVFSQSSTGQPGSPIKLTTALSSARPLFKWFPAPGADAATAIGAPSGTQIKYLYDVSHFNITSGGPESGDSTNCPVVQNPNGKFFDKDYILSPIDCDVNRCNTAVPGAQHVCRIHVQTVLVDESDRTLGWSAGADLYYCIEGQSNCP